MPSFITFLLEASTNRLPQSAFTSSNLTIEPLEQGVKCVQS